MAAATSASGGRSRPAMRLRRTLLAAALGCAAAPCSAWAADAPPRAATLSQGWEVRVEPAAPAPPQEAPPEETAPEATAPPAPTTPAGRAAQAPGEWLPARVPGVFDPRALPGL